MTELPDGVRPSRFPSVLLVNVEPRFREAVSSWLETRGWTVRTAIEPRQALGRWSALGAPLALADLDGADADGFELLQGLAGVEPRPRVLVRVPEGTAAELGAVLARLGATAVLGQPCRVDAVEEALARMAAAPGPPAPAPLARIVPVRAAAPAGAGEVP